MQNPVQVLKPALVLCAVFLVAHSLVPSAYAESKQRLDYDRALDDSCWQISFVEEFDQLSLRTQAKPEGRWTTRYIWPRDVIINEELQYYLDPELGSASPFSVSEGVLSIEANKSRPNQLSEVQNQPYTSGVLTTQKSFAQKYGRFEARIQVPSGRGLWPAFWLLPSFEKWPEGVAVLPEIDVMEFLGHDLDTYHTTLHTNQSGELTSHPYEHLVGTDLSKGFHLYSVVWTPERVYWYFDKQPVASHPTPDDFTQPVHFLLNLAVGGSWAGKPDENTQFPSRYRVDKVSAWTQKANCS